MKASAVPAVALALAVLGGCTAPGGPEDASKSSSPDAATSSPRASSDSPETTSPTPSSFPDPAGAAKPDIPNIALRKDGKTPIPCAAWSGLSGGRQRDLVFSALVQSFVIPVTDAKVRKARRMVDTNCKSEPKSAAYMVALRAAKSV